MTDHIKNKDKLDLDIAEIAYFIERLSIEIDENKFDLVDMLEFKSLHASEKESIKTCLMHRDTAFMNMYKLSEDLQASRDNKPEAYVMDRFIRASLNQERLISLLKNQNANLKNMEAS